MPHRIPNKIPRQSIILCPFSSDKKEITCNFQALDGYFDQITLGQLADAVVFFGVEGEVAMKPKAGR